MPCISLSLVFGNNYYIKNSFMLLKTKTVALTRNSETLVQHFEFRKFWVWQNFNYNLDVSFLWCY